MKQTIFLSILFSALISFAEEQACKSEKKNPKIEKLAINFLAKIKSIEPKYKSITWNTKIIPGAGCAGKEHITDGGISCVYECDATNGGSGLKMKISEKGQLLGFSYYEP